MDPVIVHEAFSLVVSAVVVMVLGLPIIKAVIRRFELKPVRPIELAGIELRLQRIETAVDTIAVEVERIAESQRFDARLREGRVPDKPNPALSSGNR
jgi:hypothetical protein